jgi:hypothetical protein
MIPPRHGPSTPVSSVQGRLRRVVARYGNDNHLRIELVFNTVVEICLCKRRIVDCQPIIGVID